MDSDEAPDLIFILLNFARTFSLFPELENLCTDLQAAHSMQEDGGWDRFRRHLSSGTATRKVVAGGGL